MTLSRGVMMRANRARRTPLKVRYQPVFITVSVTWCQHPFGVETSQLQALVRIGGVR